MILDESIIVNSKGCRKTSRYKLLGYDITKESFEVKVSDLTNGSREIVNVECDFCRCVVSITYREYLRNISIGNKYACSKFCGSEKAKESNLEKYGKINAMCLQVTQDKQKNTNLKKYGVEYLQQSKDLKEKSRRTLISKYGVEHISKSEYFKYEFKKTCLEKYGVEYPMMDKSIFKKSKLTLLLNYGVDNPSKSKKVILKIRKTNLERYGNETYIKTEDFKMKNKNTLHKKWISDNIMKSDIFRENRFSISKDINYINYLDNSVSKLKCGNDHEFNIHIDNYIKRSLSNITLCTICNPIGDSKSIKEKDILCFIESIYNGDIISSYRDVLELDIYLPDLKIGFEFNGLYWHSNEYKEKNYHLYKTNHFKEKGIRVIHIWEDDWDLKKNIIKSQIKNYLGITENKIFARKCQIKEVLDTKLVKKFLDDNHIQGHVNSIKKIGLYYNNELVSLMTFDKFEGRKKMIEGEWNLSRFCSKLNTSVIGGASKLLNYFTNIENITKVISYSDNCWSDGSVYILLGFDRHSEISPDYKYIIDKKRCHKSSFRKSRLDTNLSESEYMSLNEIRRIYDCGRTKFIKNLLRNK